MQKQTMPGPVLLLRLRTNEPQYVMVFLPKACQVLIVDEIAIDDEKLQQNPEPSDLPRARCRCMTGAFARAVGASRLVSL